MAESTRRAAENGGDGVAAVDRAVAILTALGSVNADALTLAQLAAITGLYKSTILRLLDSLQRCVFVVRLADGRYQLGPGLAGIAARVERGLKLDDYVAPVLERIVAACGETAALFTRSGTARLCLVRVESPQPIRHQINPGQRGSLTNSASGKVLRDFVDGAGSNPRALLALPVVMLRTLEVEVAAVAMPIFGFGDRLVGAISVSGPRARFAKAKVRRISELVIAGAIELTTKLGSDATIFAPVRDRHRYSRF